MKFFETLKNTTRLSLYSPIYVLICGAVTFFCWMTGQALLGMVILMLIASVVLVISQDILPILPCLIYVIFNTSNNEILNQDKTWPVMIVLAILLIGAFISHLISYPIKFKKHKLTFPLIATTIALFLGGIGYLDSKQYMQGIVFILTLGPCLLVIYYLIRSYTKPPEGIDHKKYICYIMLVLGLIIVLQVITHWLKTDKHLSELLRVDELQVGWGNRNGIAALLIIIAPCCFYLAYNNKNFAWMFYAIGLIFYAFVMLTFCRSGIMATLITLPILIIYSFAKGANRSQLLIVICSLAIFICSIVLIKVDVVVDILSHVSNLTLTSSGRTKLYEEALVCFLRNPMFGVGLGYVGNNFNMQEFCIYWFHCTVLQIIASAGIVGLFAYAYFYFVRGKIMFCSLKRFNITLSLGIVAFEIQSLLDASTFIPFPYMLIVITLTAILEHNNKLESKTFMKSININNSY